MGKLREKKMTGESSAAPVEAIPPAAPALKPVLMDIAQLSPDPANARKHGEKNLEAIKSSLRRFGQQKPIVVDKAGIVRAGNGTLAAAKALGWTKIAVVVTDLVGTEATAFGIADNRTAELAEWEKDVLEGFLSDPTLGDVGFDEADLAKALQQTTQLNNQSRAKDDADRAADAGKQTFTVLAECEDEAQQLAIIEDLTAKGLKPRALLGGFTEENRPPVAPANKLKPAAGKVITRATAIARTPRVVQMEGLFDVSPEKKSEQTWTLNLDFPKRWNIGVIVGPSGSGKSTIAKELFGDLLGPDWKWPADKSILDGFPADMPIAEVTGILSSVGFSSPPAWLRPFHVLSNGQQFRVQLARTLAEAIRDGQPKLIDEYTSVVDRTVAQVGSAAVASTVRRHGLQFIAVSCHYDVLEWLEPDWVYDLQTGELARGCLQRPKIQLEIRRADKAAWRTFGPHHYLSAGLNPSARCFVAYYRGRPAAFTAVIHFPHAKRPSWREHRTVCLPDFQGVGIGNTMSEFVASLFTATGKPYSSVTSHPAMIRHRIKSPLWRVTHPPSMISGSQQNGLKKRNGKAAQSTQTSFGRMTASFEYIGPSRPEDAKEFGLLKEAAGRETIPASPAPRTA